MARPAALILALSLALVASAFAASCLADVMGRGGVTISSPAPTPAPEPPSAV